MGSDGVRWGPMGSDGVRWGQMGSDGVRWGQMGSDGVGEPSGEEHRPCVAWLCVCVHMVRVRAYGACACI
eukprot:3492963-Prymnesium_polylepis.1